MKKIFALFTLMFLIQNLSASDLLQSSTFDDMIKKVVKNDNYIFNENIKIKVPSFADNPLQVPIFVDAKNIKNAKRMILLADYNPISEIIDINLSKLLPVLSLNIKVAQETPVRVFILDDKNTWHIASKNIRSNGGGCDVSTQTTSNYEFEKFLGDIKGNIFKRDDSYRIKTSIFHPMETGFVFGTNEFYINSIIMKSNENILAEAKLTSVISENPRFIFETKNNSKSIDIEFADSDGNKYKAIIK